MTEQRQLTIQVGVCKRMLKEVSSYEKEVAENEGILQKMRDDNREIHDIRKFEEVLQESYMMIPDSNRRLEASIDTLRNLIDELADNPSVDATLKKEAADVVDAYEKKQKEFWSDLPKDMNSEVI